MKPVPVEELDFATLLRPGDRIVVGQATSEPLTLTRHLMQSRDLPQGCRVFLGPVYSDTFEAETASSLSFESYGAIGNAAALARRRRLDVLPWHYSALAKTFSDGGLRADCVLLQAAPDLQGRLNTGISVDYAITAARHARLVIVEINENAPRTPGGDWPADIPVHVAISAKYPPLEFPPPEPGATERRIADGVVSLIPDKAVLQFGVGSVPHAVAAGLHGHRDIGIHSGVLVDGVVDLVERGIVTNASKEIDTGVTVAGVLIGSRRLFDFANGNRSVRLCGPAHTHALDVIARLSRFCAINSAVEVDLTGQVNAETAGSRYVGAVGGQVDFTRGANASAGGRAIIALPATAAGGKVSRIVPRVSTVTCARSDTDAIVTEWGIAELRGVTLPQRVEKMIAIAAPQFREDLARAGFELLRGRDG